MIRLGKGKKDRMIPIGSRALAWIDKYVTEVRPAVTFYAAEDYHQQYFTNHPNQPYCAFVVSPKVQKFRRKFAARLRQGA